MILNTLHEIFPVCTAEILFYYQTHVLDVSLLNKIHCITAPLKITKFPNGNFLFMAKLIKSNEI